MQGTVGLGDLYEFHNYNEKTLDSLKQEYSMKWSLAVSLSNGEPVKDFN